MSRRRGRGPRQEASNRSTRHGGGRGRSRRTRAEHSAINTPASAPEHASSASEVVPSASTSQPSQAPAQIPGYHFDSQTNRYYRIVGNHQASTGAISTSRATERSLASKARSRALAKHYRDRRRFKHSNFSNNSTAAILLRLEVTTRRQIATAKDNIKGAYLADLHGSVKSTKHPRVWLDGDIFIQGEHGRRGLAKINFHYDSSRQLLMFGLVNQYASRNPFFQGAAFLAAFGPEPFVRTTTQPSAASPCGVISELVALHCMSCTRPDPSMGPEFIVPPVPRIVFAPGSRYILCLGARKVLALTACILSRRVNGPRAVNWSPIVIGIRPEVLDDMDPTWGLPTMASDFEIVAHDMVIDTPDDSPPPWEHICIAIRPDDMYDISTSLHLDFLSGGQHYFATTSVDMRNNGAFSESSWAQSAVTAMIYITAHTWLYGMRNGSLCSTNSDEDSWQYGSNLLANHGGAVTNLYLLKGKQYLIVNGLGNKMYLYRLRANKDFSTLGNLSESSMKKTQANQIVAVMKYDHQNARYPSDQLGFDVCEELGLIAAAQDNGTIKIFAIFSGATLATLTAPQSPEEGGHDQPGDVRLPPMFTTVQIIPEETGVCRILGARRGRIYDFAQYYD